MHVNTQKVAHVHALKCLFVNVRGLVSKIELLRKYGMKIDIIGVAETFLNNDVIIVMHMLKSILRDILCIEKIGVKKEKQVVSS